MVFVWTLPRVLAGLGLGFLLWSVTNCGGPALVGPVEIERPMAYAATNANGDPVIQGGATVVLPFSFGRIGIRPYTDNVITVDGLATRTAVLFGLMDQDVDVTVVLAIDPATGTQDVCVVPSLGGLDLGAQCFDLESSDEPISVEGEAVVEPDNP